MVQYSDKQIWFTQQKMLSKIANYFHILKARIVVAYALLHVCGFFYGFGIRNSICKPLMENTLFLIKYPLICLNKGFPVKIEYAKGKKIYNILYKDFFREYIAHRKTPLADYAYVIINCPSLGSYFPRIIGVAWLCEKLGINVKFTFPNTRFSSYNLFENSVLNYAKACHPENFAKLKKPLTNLGWRKGYISLWEAFPKCKISSEYGYKIISKLSIKQEIQQQANQWFDANIKGACVGVHYRQTDSIQEIKTISIDNYINYLKRVLDDHYQIYACSDTAHFIDAMHEAFPSRVVSRDITRSTDGRSLHRHEPYTGYQQRQDALIDILTLSKCKMIYTVGSCFIDVIRFFNPAIKIIDLSGQGKTHYKKIPNYLPIPRMDLVRKAQADTTWKEGLHYNKLPHHIETEKITEK